MRKTWWILSLALVIALAPTLAFADGDCGKCQKSAWTKEEGYGNKVLQKFYFGAKNTLAGWTEVISRPEKALKEDKSFWKGLGSGLVIGVVDTVGGVLHLATFPLPQIDVPLPDGGVQL